MVRSVRFAIQDEELRGCDRPRRVVWELDDLPDIPPRRSRPRQRFNQRPAAGIQSEGRRER